MELNLKKPVAFFDLETTGINVVKDRIVEICIIRVNTDGTEDVKTLRINPTVPIPAQASEVHGIYDADVADKPTFAQVGKELATFLKDCDVAGYNSNKFDVPLLAEEFLRAGIDFDFTKRKRIDVQVIFHKKEQRTLSAAYKFYCGKELEGAHGAEADTRATYEVLKSQLDKYDDLNNDMDYLAEFSSHNKNADFLGRIVFDENNVEVFNFGKHKGKSVESVFEKEPSYYNWMMNGDFPLSTKQVITAIKLRKLQF